MINAAASGGYFPRGRGRGSPWLGTNLTDARLSGADLSWTLLGFTVFASTALDKVKGLDHCYHSGPCMIDFQTLKKSGPLPLAFLRGVGLSDRQIAVSYTAKTILPACPSRNRCDRLLASGARH